MHRPCAVPFAGVVTAVGVLLAVAAACPIGLDRAGGLDPRFARRRRALTIVAYTSTFGVALCTGALPAAAA